MKDNTNEFVSKILAIALVTGALAGCADGVIRVSYKAVTLSAQGYYDKALPLAQESLAIREQTLGPDHPDTAKSLNNLAEIYRSIGRYTEAEPLYKRSLAISEKALGPYHPDTAGSLNNLAFIYNSTGRYAEAETFYKRALAICEKILGPDHPDTARSLTNLAGLYLDSGRFDEGYVIFKKQNSPYGLGKYYLLKKDYSSAQREFARSLSYTRKMGQPHFLIADHTGLGLSYEGMGDYVKAKERFREAINLTESQWKTLAPEVKKDFLTAQTGAGFTRMDAYEGLIRVLVKEKSQGYGKESFVVAEKVKGRLFLEMLATREAKGKTREDETVLKKDMEYQWELMRLHKQLEAETEADQISEETRNALSAKEKEYSTFIEEVKLKGGELASLITADPIGIPALQSLLDPSTTLLEYFTGKEATYAWLVTKNDIKVYEIPITEKDLRQKVDTLLLPNISNKSRRPMPVMVAVPSSSQVDTTPEERERNRRYFTEAGKAFYRDILSPVEKDIKTPNLIIVPHGVLHKVPFAALSDGNGYLVDKYSISILPSASVLEYVVKKRKPFLGTILTLANPSTDYVPLGFAEKEGETISKLFTTSEVYTRNRATETLAKDKSTSFNVIHFASHGQFNERQPLQSGLILAKDTQNDGYLQVHEIFSMNLANANLVTLSACETALAKVQGGDDLVGLSRGFIYAGTPSLLATLWEVDDQSTSIIMESFYKNWLKGMTKPEALRQAQIALKKMPQYAHPYYWAAFEMIGDWQ